MDTREYTIGKGVVYIKLASDPANTWRDLGNCPDFKTTLEKEMLEHFSSRSGLKKKDRDLLIGQRVKWSCTLENVNKDNLELFLLSTSPTVISHTGGTVSSAESFDGVIAGRVLQVANPYNIYDVVVKDDSTPTPVTFIEDTDYEVDSAEGYVRLLSTGAITSGKNIRITYKHATISQGTGTVSAEVYDDIDQGDVVQLANRNVSSVVVKDDVSETFVVSDDYTVDAINGKITIVEGGGIADGTNLRIDYAYGAMVDQYKFDVAAKGDIHTGYITFVGDPPKGRKLTIKGYGSISPTGDMQVISDELMKLSLEGEFYDGKFDGIIEVKDRGLAV